MGKRSHHSPSPDSRQCGKRHKGNKGSYGESPSLTERGPKQDRDRSSDDHRSKPKKHDKHKHAKRSHSRSPHSDNSGTCSSSSKHRQARRSPSPQNDKIKHKMHSHTPSSDKITVSDNGHRSKRTNDSHKERRNRDDYLHHRIKGEPMDHYKDHRRHDDRRDDSRQQEDNSHGSRWEDDDRPDRRMKEEPDERRSRWENDDRPSRVMKEEPADRTSFREQQRSRQQNDDRRREVRQRRDQHPDSNNFGRPQGEEEPAVDKEKPNFKLSGKLTEDTNTFRGVVIKYNEPAEARKPKRRWRLYCFKGDDSLPFLPIHRQSAYLLGRDRRVADIPIDHPSCSKQHAVFQYRLTDYIRPDGTQGRKVRPYIIDLGSANGTFVNNQRIEASRYVELFEQDLIKFGFSTREFVLLPENADTSEVAQNSDTE